MKLVQTKFSSKKDFNYCILNLNFKNCVYSELGFDRFHGKSPLANILYNIRIRHAVSKKELLYRKRKIVITTIYR